MTREKAWKIGMEDGYAAGYAAGFEAGMIAAAPHGMDAADLMAVRFPARPPKRLGSHRAKTQAWEEARR
jgi:uncharacterized FAD-dependent dehydrogenase